VLQYCPVRSGLIEGGLAFLLLFAPFAFGGAEVWALGVIQIVSCLVFVAWAWRYDDRPPDRSSFRLVGQKQNTLTALWVVFGLFIALVIFQLVPLPSDWMLKISPATHSLYRDTLPGYTTSKKIHPADLPVHLAPGEDDNGIAAGPGRALAAGEIPSALGGDLPWSVSTRRTLSIYPFRTRQNLTLLLCCAALFIVVVSYFRTQVRLQRLLDACVAVAFLISLFGILQKFSGTDLIYWMRAGPHGEFFGPFVNRNSYAAFAGAVLPVSLGLALGQLRAWRRGRAEALPRLLFYGFAAVVMTTGIGLSLSRGGMLSSSLALVLLLAWLFYLGRREMEIRFMGGFAVIAGAALLWLQPGAVVDRVETLSEGLSTPSLAMRLEAWKKALVLIQDYPYLGTGLGTFRFAYLGYAPPGKAWWTTAHNEYIELLCDMGLAGAFLCLLGLFFYFRRVLRPQVINGRTAPYAFAGLLAGLVAILTHSLISSNLQVPANSIMLVVLAGALVCLVSRQEAQTDVQGRHARRGPKLRETH
jgi:O-antigen ligase